MEGLLTDYPTQCVSDVQIRTAIDNILLGDQSEEKETGLLIADQALKTIKYRPLLRSWIYNCKAYVYETQKKYKDSIGMYIASTNLLDSLYAEVTVQRQETLLKLGSSYYRIGDKENADKAYFMAMKFPYYIFPTNDNEVLRRLEIAYRRSIMGLIMARAGNVQKLKEIRIIPAANDLRPKLEAAIKRAEGKADK